MLRRPPSRMSLRVPSKYWCLLLLLVLPAVQAANLRASPPPVVDISRIKDGRNLGAALSFLEDRSGGLTIRQITAPGAMQRFSPGTGPSMNHGFSRSAYWVVFRLGNRSGHEKTILLEAGFPLIDHVDLYQPGEDSGFTVQKAGELIPIPERTFKYRNPVFPISIPAMTEKTFYIRYQDRGSVPFSLSLWQPDNFTNTIKDRQYGLGIYYGTMLVIIVYNLVIFLMVRIRSYLFYIIYVSVYVFWQMAYNGLASEYLWTSQPWLTDRIMPLLICATCLSALQFTKTFLKTRDTVPVHHRSITILMTALCLLSAVSLLPDFSLGIPLAAMLAVVFAPVVMVTGLACWQKGYRPARYFVIAWSMLLAGTALLGLKSFGVLPSTFITEYGQQLGSALEAALLSLALADQVNTMRREKEAALAETARIQQETNERLEILVWQRTHELQARNSELDVLSTKLSKYLSPQLYAAIFTGRKDVRLQSSRKKLTVFFSDIKNFTEMTDSMEPEALTGLINDYLDEMAAIVLAYGGTIDKFIGDAIMVFFGDPETRGDREDALCCVCMAIAMRKRMAELQTKWRTAATGKTLRIRMGINTGYCTVGNLGSENRMDYTIIGGQVNLASRLESLAEPDQILISSATHALIRDLILCEKKGSLPVRGIAYPVETYQVVDLHDNFAGGNNEIKHAGRGYSLTLNLHELSSAAKAELATSLSDILAKL